MNLARFTIQSTPSTNGGYDAAAGAVLSLALEGGPSSAVQRTTFQVYDAAQPDAPYASKNAPALTLVGATSGSKVDALTPGAAVTVTMPASAPLGHSWRVRCYVNGGIDQLGKANPDYVFERLVVIRAPNGARKVVLGEGTSYGPRSEEDAQNEIVEALAGTQIAAGPINFTGEIAIQRQGVTRLDSTATDTRLYAATAAGQVKVVVNGLNIGGFGTFAGASTIPVFFFDGPQSSTAGTVAFGVAAPTTGPGANFIISGQNAAGANQGGGPVAVQTGAPTGAGAIGPLSLTVSTAASTVTVTLTDTTVTVQQPTVQWDISTVAPTLAQVTGFGASAVGNKLTVHAQDQIGATSTGGALDVRPGSGTTAGGLARLLSGSAVARMSWNDQGLGFFGRAPIAQMARVGQLTSGAGTPGTGTADVGAAFSQATLNNNFATILAKLNGLELVVSQGGGGFGLTA